MTDNAALVYNLYGVENATYAITGSGSLLKTGSGMLVLQGNNSYGGGTTVNGGTLQVGYAGAIPYGPGVGDLTINGSGVFDLAGNATNINGLWGNGTADDSVGGGTLTVGNNDATSTYSGTIQNSNSTVGFLALDKVGSGTLTLTGTNTYLGGTTANDGTLIVTNNEGLADGSNLAVGDPASLSLFSTVVPAEAGQAALSPAAAPVPEPGTLALLAGAAAAAVLTARKRFSRAARR